MRLVVWGDRYYGRERKIAGTLGERIWVQHTPAGRLYKGAEMTKHVVNLGSGNNTYTPTPQNDDYVITAGDGNNTITLGSGTDSLAIGNGSNTLTLGDGTDSIKLGGGNNTVTTGNGNSHITTGNGNDTITVGTGGNVIAVGTGLDTVTTGAGKNVVSVSGTSVSGDTIMGAVTSQNGSTNQLDVTTPGTMDPVSVSGFQFYRLADGGANNLTLAEANFARLPGNSITVFGGNSGNTVDASAVTVTDRVIVHGGAGTDVLTGGAGNDVLIGGTGSNTLNGGSGNDILSSSSGQDTMTGGPGADVFLLTGLGTLGVPSMNVITDFAESNHDRIAFSNAAFDLGIDDGKGTSSFQRISPHLFSPNTDGTFATTANRFAYDTATGALNYDADGSGTAHASQLVAMLTGHPTLIYSDLAFTS